MSFRDDFACFAGKNSRLFASGEESPLDESGFGCGLSAAGICFRSGVKMKRSNTQFERHVDIDRRIRAGDYPSVPELASEWEVDERTIKRDIEFMRDRLGAPIEYDRCKKGYFYTEATWGMPAVSLREGELFALLLARNALEQYHGLPLGQLLSRFYEQVLEAAGCHTGVSPDRILEGFSFFTPPSLPINPEVWDALSRCMLQCHTAEIGYQSVSAENVQTYRVDPLHIANIEGEWYLFARSHKKGDVLQLAVSRVATVQTTGELFSMPEDFGSEKLRKQLFGRYVSMQGRPETVRISVDPSAGVHLKQWHPDQKLVRRKNGRMEISFPVNSGGSKMPYANVMAWILSMGRHAKVLAPARLKKLVEEEIRAMTD
jgi:predicted DNA-binding transcriptional regulator YafY